MNSEPVTTRAGLRALTALVRDFLAFAGRRAFWAALRIGLGAIFESIGLVLLIPLLGLVTGRGGSHSLVHRLTASVFDALAVSTLVGRLGVLLAGFCLLIILRAAVVSRRDITIARLQIEFVANLRARIAGGLTRAGWDKVLRLRHAKVLNVMSGDIMRISAASQFLLQGTIAVVVLLAQCVLSFLLSPLLSLLAFALLAIAAVAMVPVLRRARRSGQVLSGANLALMDSTAQFLNGLKLAFSQDLQSGFLGEFREIINGVSGQQIRYNRQQTAGRVAMATLTALVGATVVLVGFGFLKMDSSVLLVFLFIVARMSGPASQVQQGLQQLAYNLPSYESAMALLEELRVDETQHVAAIKSVPGGAIILEAVSYQHSATDGSGFKGVRQASLRIEPETFVGIMGPSGAGKTTLADIVAGLLRPQSGRVLIGGIPLDDAMLPTWRAQLSYITQDPFLFHDSVRRNLAWANADATEDDMWTALSLAGADDIVRRMDDGLDAVVGERGTLVSGGERQRIAIARAVLRKPRLLLMDEATNAIDVDGERALLARLRAAHPHLTILMIAHRSDSLGLCDRIVRMEDGKLFDVSRPVELSLASGAS